MVSPEFHAAMRPGDSCLEAEIAPLLVASAADARGPPRRAGDRAGGVCRLLARQDVRRRVIWEVLIPCADPVPDEAKRRTASSHGQPHASGDW